VIKNNFRAAGARRPRHRFFVLVEDRNRQRLRTRRVREKVAHRARELPVPVGSDGNKDPVSCRHTHLDWSSQLFTAAVLSFRVLVTLAD